MDVSFECTEISMKDTVNYVCEAVFLEILSTSLQTPQIEHGSYWTRI
jgi:hypothetical protein